MGSSWPGARGDPERQAAHLPGHLSAFTILKNHRGAQWSTDMEALVQYHIQTTGLDPHHKESQQQWTDRLCAAYDDQEPAMRKWLDRPLGVAAVPKQGQGGQAPGNSEEPPQGAGEDQPKDDPKDSQDNYWGKWSQDHGWSYTSSSGWDGRADASGQAGSEHPGSWGQRSTWDSVQAPGDP